MANDTADVLQVLGRADLDAWYPEIFTMSYLPGDDRQGRQGFVVMPVVGGDWIKCSLARGGFHEVPHNDAFVNVSRQEARRARAERTVAYATPKKASEGHIWQKGEKAERMLLEDVLGGANGKGMVVFVDIFGAVGDRAAAFYNIVRDRGVDANPMAFSIRSIPGSTFPLWRR